MATGWIVALAACYKEEEEDDDEGMASGDDDSGEGKDGKEGTEYDPFFRPSMA